MFKPENFNPSIAHVTDAAGNVFQVLNEAGDDMDELATLAQQQAFDNQQLRNSDGTPA